MKSIVTIYTTVLFIIFNPNIFFIFFNKIPKKNIILINTFLFGIFYYLTIDYIYYLTTINENFCNNCNENNINCFNNLGQQCVLKNSNNHSVIKTFFFYLGNFSNKLINT